MSKAVMTFSDLVKHSTYKGKGQRLVPLTNITFFLGSGFSKSWDKRYPSGTELFEINREKMNRDLNKLYSFFDQCDFFNTKNIDYNKFTEFYYKLGMLKKYPEIRPRYIDQQAIYFIEQEFKALIWQALDKQVNINYFHEGGLCHKKKNNNQKEIINFFKILFDQIDGSNGIPEGIRINFITTNYDYLIEGILDEIYGPEDGFHYPYTYRGFTPHLLNGEKIIDPLRNHWFVGNLIKINGGLEIRQDDSFFNIDYRPQILEQVINNPPEIILPTKNQDYASPYFKSIFPKAIRVLQESKILIVIGYSFPKEDALVKFILSHFAEDHRDMADKKIFYIDLGDKKHLEEKITKVFPINHEFANCLLIHNEGFIQFVKTFNQLDFP